MSGAMAAVLILCALVQPAYRWRGISLDVARHYFSTATLRRFIDLAAHYRLNVVHLHFTDNEAWRLPSRRYPLLPSAQHYTEADLRALSAYASEKGIVLVPEIDLPAHAASAIRSYPALACGAVDTLCAGRAVRFASGVITEAMQLFPGPFVHTGGDELQGWTTAQRRAFEASLDGVIRHAHRTMIVWDDQADAAPADSIVEVWHLGAAATNAAQRGHRVILAPDGPLYFDAVQGAASQEPRGSPYMSTLEEVYAFSAPADALGAEAVVWSEYVTSDSQLWPLLLPREIAFGQTASYGARKPPWPFFRDRILPVELDWLAQHGYPFRVPNTLFSVDDPSARYTGVAGNQDAAVVHTRRARITFTIRSLLPQARIMYRIGPQSSWQRYAKPFSMRVTDDLRIDARSVSPNGRSSAVTTLLVSSSEPADSSTHFDDVVSP